MADNIRTGFLLLFSHQTVGTRAPFCIYSDEPASWHTFLAFSFARKPLQSDFTVPHMYWWFAYDVIKDMIMQITINFPQILIWSIRPYNMSLTKFEVIWANENRVTGKKMLEIFYYGIWENGLVGFLLPISYKCIEIFKTLNSRNFCIYWCINMILAEIFQNEVIYIV